MTVTLYHAVMAGVAVITLLIPILAGIVKIILSVKQISKKQHYIEAVLIVIIKALPVDEREAAKIMELAIKNNPGKDSNTIENYFKGFLKEYKSRRST